jgi:outer membrane protein TolC
MRILQLFIRGLTGLTVLACSHTAPVFADQSTVPALPDPLTLEFALSRVDTEHPDMLRAQADVDIARATEQRAEADQGIQTTLEGRLRWVDPSSIAPTNQHDDNQISLLVRKKLYDFGKSDASIASAKSSLKSQEWLYTSSRDQRRIDIMQAFFNVIIADLLYARDNEAMATAYVNWDRSRDRNKLGQISDIQLAEAEYHYQQARNVRYASDVKRRVQRSALANLLNVPGQLPANLVTPKLPVIERKLPEVDTLMALARQQNPRLQAIREEVEAAQQRLQAARAGNKPVIQAELEASEYSRDLGSRDPFRAGISIQVPLTTGGAVDAEIAQQRAAWLKSQANLRKTQMDIEQRVLELWQAIYVLNAGVEKSKVYSDYRDLYLDRSRGLYELDVKADLGDAMVQFSDARYQTYKTMFDLALAWAKMDALIGHAEIPAAGDNNQ